MATWCMVHGLTLFPFQSYPHMACLVQLPVLPRSHREWCLIHLLFTAFRCPYIACLLRFPVPPCPHKEWSSCLARPDREQSLLLLSPFGPPVCRAWHLKLLPFPRRHMPMYGVIWHGITHSLTHARAVSRNFEIYKCYSILNLSSSLRPSIETVALEKSTATRHIHYSVCHLSWKIKASAIIYFARRHVV